MKSVGESSRRPVRPYCYLLLLVAVLAYIVAFWVISEPVSREPTVTLTETELHRIKTEAFRQGVTAALPSPKGTP